MPPTGEAGSEIAIPDPRLANSAPCQIIRDDGDRLEVKLAMPASSVLILSRTYHAHCRASVLIGERHEWLPAECIRVNGSFQAVRIPGGATQCQIEFLNNSRFAWIVNVFWIGVSFAVILLWLFLRTGRKHSSRVGAAV